MKLFMRFFIGVISLFSLVLIFAWHFEIGINVTPSLPKGIYRKLNEKEVKNEELRHGDIVQFCLNNKVFIKIARENEYLGSGICESNLRPLLKLVAGMAGDTISIRDNGIYVTKQNKNIACVWDLPKEFDSKGRPMISLLESGVIPSGKILLLTPYKGSFDSRYFGLVDSNTVFKSIALFTFQQGNNYGNYK